MCIYFRLLFIVTCFECKGWLAQSKKLGIKTLIYSWLIFVVVISITGLKNLSITKILTAIFPVVFGEYWFITGCYLFHFLIECLRP
ncbi:hypothetical protein LJ_1036 [Lactobacillus johnsonii NCC 533]|uniref:Uncharacterized protein n=1 Tax=Lactobacillus johnsonii (strain CNCM I-12250 / La1 / NCC 533) TaxID=257314 RepID=Q74JR9_LACJO|nr:hypothetical protein LJ_1036 [Lactobacillus johnsonii NCC 533]